MTRVGMPIISFTNVVPLSVKKVKNVITKVILLQYNETTERPIFYINDN